MSDIPDLDRAPYSEALRRTLYDAVRQLQLPEHSEPFLFHAWGRWFAVWEDHGEDHRHLPLLRRWEVVRIPEEVVPLPAGSELSLTYDPRGTSHPLQLFRLP